MSINDSLLMKEERDDDHLLEDDPEPISCTKDFHIPATNKIVVKPAAVVVPEIINKTPTVSKKLS
jgi:hypothetical protein